MKLFACLLSLILAYGSAAPGFNIAAATIAEAMSKLARGRPASFTTKPNAAFLGDNPGRDNETRGGAWSKEALAAAQQSNLLSGLYTSLSPFLPLDGEHTRLVSPDPGGPYHWEGSYPSHDGIINTANGNKLTILPLFSFKVRGGMSIDLTLYHNSESTYNDELGRGWSWSYNIYIAMDGTTPIVHWGDDLSIPFPLVNGVYTAPDGISDVLTKSGSIYTLTKKDGTKYKFDLFKFLDYIEDRNGNQINFIKNAGNYTTKIIDPMGREVVVASDTHGHFTSVTAPNGKVWTFSVEETDEKLTEVSWPTINSQTYKDEFSYKTAGDKRPITTHKDKRGKEWTADYNSDGSIAWEETPLTDRTTFIYQSTYTDIRTPLWTTGNDPDYRVRHNYSSSVLASEVDEAGFSENYLTRDSNKYVTKIEDRNDNGWWEYTYDSKGNVLTAQNPLDKTWTYTYNSFSQVLTRTSPPVTGYSSGMVSEWQYDTDGNLEEVYDGLNRRVVQNTFDTYGRILTSKTALDKQTDYTWGGTYGELTVVTDPEDHETTLAYDGMSRVTSAENDLGDTTTLTYDDWGRRYKITHPGGTYYQQTAFDPESNVTSWTNERSKVWTYAYDDSGRLISETNPRSDIEEYTWDANSRRTEVENGRGKTRVYEYTPRGEVSSLTLPGENSEYWAYDGNGNTTAYTNGLEQTIGYEFDDADRLELVNYPSPATDTAFTYDDADRETSMVDSIGTTSWTYNGADELVTLDTPQGDIDYTYFDDGQRETMDEDGVGTTSYTYTDDGLPETLTNSFSETTYWYYDDADRLEKQTFHSGAYTLYGYDNRSRTTSVTQKKSDNSTISAETYQYDAASNLTQKTVDSVITTFTYDEIDQLLSEGKTGYAGSYTYDANGNRLTKTLGGTTETYSYSDSDELIDIKVGGTTVKSFGYDAAGRTTGITYSGLTTTLAYDYESRITQVSRSGVTTNTFTYNGLDTRVGKVDSGGTKTFKRDGAYVTDPVLSDGAANYTPGISEKRSGTTKYNLDDRLGTFTRQTDSSQATSGTRSYDAFGLPTGTTGSPTGPFGFAGGWGYQEDGDYSFKLLGYRYYDPSTGRFLSRDSVKDGRNWYVYCGSNPFRYVDPTGLRRRGFLEWVRDQAVGAWTGAGEVIKVGGKVVGGSLFFASVVGLVEAQYESNLIRDYDKLLDRLNREGKLNDETWDRLKRQKRRDGVGIAFIGLKRAFEFLMRVY